MLVLTDPTRSGRSTVAVGGEDGGQGAHFDRVAQGGAGAVRFHVIDLVRLQPRIGQRAAEDCLLGQPVGRGQAVTATVLIDCRTAQQAEDPIPCRLGLREPFEQQHATTFTTHETVGLEHENV